MRAGDYGQEDQNPTLPKDKQRGGLFFIFFLHRCPEHPMSSTVLGDFCTDREQASVPPVWEAEAIGQAAKTQGDLAGSLRGGDGSHHTVASTSLSGLS